MEKPKMEFRLGDTPANNIQYIDLITFVGEEGLSAARQNLPHIHKGNFLPLDHV